MTSKALKQLISEAAECGFPDARLRDAAFAILNHTVRDSATSFALLFPGENPETADSYADSPLAKTLAKRAKILLAPPKQDNQPRHSARAVARPADNPDSDLSFDENKAAMLRMLREIEEQKQLPDADVAKLLKIEADIRVKLNDKFEVTTAAEQQLIIVQPKFNHICEHTGRECWLQTREFAISHWGLIDPASQQ